MGDILFLAHRVPFPPNRGDKIRSANLLRKLVTIGPVHVGCFAESDEDRAGMDELCALASSHEVVNRAKPLVLAGVEAVLAGKPVSLTAFHSKRLEQWVHSTIADHDIGAIVIFSGQMGQYVPEDFAGSVIIDLCDVDSAKFESYAAAGDRVWLNAREGRLLACEEERLARRADATILISTNEGALLRTRLERPDLANVQIIGNGIDTDFFDPAKVAPHEDIAARKGPHFVFTGQMDYPPNETAALWAIEHFLPAIRAHHAAAELHFVGRSPTAKLLAQRNVSGVTIWGEVPDVRPFLAAADVALAPLQIARGVQNKVLEAMAMAKPVVVTSQAATGISAEDGKHWFLSEANGPRMAEACADIIADKATSAQIGIAARQFVLEHHNWDAMLSPLEELVMAKREEERDAA